jgi:hypothetical protein
MWFVTGGIGHGLLSPDQPLPRYELVEEDTEIEGDYEPDDLDIEMGEADEGPRGLAC